MRVDLHVPYSQKDLAKSKGARWDAARKTWYVIDPPDMRAFALWMGQEVKDWYKGGHTKPAKAKKQNKKTKRKEKLHEPNLTESSSIKTCGCDVLPWDDCEHTDAQAHQAMLEMLSLSDLKL